MINEKPTKPINYVYNKQMLKKIQAIDGHEKSNEMEIKNYAEELDNLELQLKAKRDTIRRSKELVIKQSVYSNKSIPDSWKQSQSHTNFILGTLSRDKVFTDYMGKQDLEVIPEMELPPVSKSLNLPLIVKKENLWRFKERQISIARQFKTHKMIKRQIFDLMKKNNNFHNAAESVIMENFIEEPKENKLTDQLQNTGQVCDAGSSTKILIFNEEETNLRKSSVDVLSKIKSKNRHPSSENTSVYGQKLGHYDKVIETESDHPDTIETKRLIERFNTNLSNISKLGLRQSIMINNELLKGSKIKDRVNIIKTNILQTCSDDELMKTEGFDSISNLHHSKSIVRPENFKFFLEGKERKFKGLYKINDPKIKEKIYELSDSKHYGPYSSYCKGCNLKNVNFYNQMEPQRGNQILDFLLKNYHKTSM